MCVLCAPGSIFTFTGRSTFRYIGTQELVLVSATDGNRYEIRLNPAAVEGDARALLQEGASVTVAARFNGKGYGAGSVTQLPASGKKSTSPGTPPPIPLNRHPAGIIH